MVRIAVIDCSDSTLNIHKIQSGLNSEEIEEVLSCDFGYHISQISWGEINSIHFCD